MLNRISSVESMDELAQQVHRHMSVLRLPSIRDCDTDDDDTAAVGTKKMRQSIMHSRGRRVSSIENSITKALSRALGEAGSAR